MTTTKEEIKHTPDSITEYRGYTIEPSCGYWRGYDWFKTSEGRDEDGEVVDGDWKYRSNVGTSKTILQAKRDIDDKIFETTEPYVVRMNGTLYTFLWLADALGFAKFWDGIVLTEFNAI